MNLPERHFLSTKIAVVSVCAAVIIAALTSIFVVTRTPDHPAALVSLDTLCNSDPKLASEKVARYVREHSPMDSEDKWYCRFLSFKAGVKQMSGIEDDKEARALLKHYEFIEDESVLQQLYYYVGSAYHFLGDYPQAMEYLHKGLLIIPETRETEELRGLYYYMTGEILTYQHLDKEALDMEMKSYGIFKKHRNFQRMVYCCISISWSMKCLDKPDKSVTWLNTAKTLAARHGMPEILPEIECQLADRFYEQGKFRQAEKHINSVLSVEGSSENSAVLTVAANVSVALKEYDKAKEYYNRIIECGTVYSKQLAYKFLADHYRKSGDKDKAYGYCMEYCAATDTIVQLTASEYSAKSNAMFNYKYIEKEKDDLQLKLKTKNLVIAISLAAVALSVVFVCVYLYRARRRQRKMNRLLAFARGRNEDMLAKHKSELAELKENLHTVTEGNSALQDKYRQKEAELEKLLQKHELQDKVSESAERIFKETEIYRQLERICRNGEKVTENTVDWKLLEETLYGVFPTFRSGMMNFKRMKEQPYHVCLLTKAGFSVKEIAYLTVKTVEGISSTRRRLYELNFGRKGKPSEWDEVIRSL